MLAIGSPTSARTNTACNTLLKELQVFSLSILSFFFTSYYVFELLVVWIFCAPTLLGFTGFSWFLFHGVFKKEGLWDFDVNVSFVVVEFFKCFSFFFLFSLISWASRLPSFELRRIMGFEDRGTTKGFMSQPKITTKKKK